MPRESFEELLTPANDDSPSSEACAAAVFSACDETVYDGKNMEAIVEMLLFLNARLDVVSRPLLFFVVCIRKPVRIHYSLLASMTDFAPRTWSLLVNASAHLISCASKYDRGPSSLYDRGLSALLHDELHWLNIPSECSTSLP